MNESIKGDEFDELRRIRNAVNYYAKDVNIGEGKMVLERMKVLREETLQLL